MHDRQQKKSLSKEDINAINQTLVETSLGQRYKECVEDFRKVMNDFDFNIAINEALSKGKGGGWKQFINRVYDVNGKQKSEQDLFNDIKSLMKNSGKQLTSREEEMLRKFIRQTRTSEKEFTFKDNLKGWMNDRTGAATEGSGLTGIIAYTNNKQIHIYPTGAITYTGARNVNQFKDIFQNKSHPKEYSGSQQKIDDFMTYDGQTFTVSMKSHWGSPGRHDNTIQSNPQRLRHLFELANLYGMESGGVGYWIFLNDALFNNINWTLNKIKLVYGSYFGNADLFMEWTYIIRDNDVVPQLYIHTKEDIINYLYKNNKIKLASNVDVKRLKVTWDDTDPEYNKKLVLNNIFINALTINLSSIGGE